MSKTQLFSKLVDERERCRVERLKNRQNEIILEQVGRRRRPSFLLAPHHSHAVPMQSQSSLVSPITIFQERQSPEVVVTHWLYWACELQVYRHSERACRG